MEFAGFEIGPNTVKPSRKYTQAISDFPIPKTITDVRSWFGLINQVAYTFSMTETMKPFRDLLKPSNKFHWTDDHQTAFTLSKEKIVAEITQGVEIYDKSKPTCLATDWSKEGIGFWLFQKHCQCPSRDIFCCTTGWRICLVGSRFTHAAEAKYAPIEGEALAVADALEKARHFVLGCDNLTIAVDHKPLLKIFGDRALEQLHNSRLRNLKEKTLKYRFRMVHIPGVKNITSDALSRHPSGTTTPPKMILQDDQQHLHIPSTLMSGLTIESTDTIEECLTEECIANLTATQPITWEQLKEATTSDEQMLLLIDTIEEGFPEHRSTTPVNIRDYHIHRDNLYTVDGVVVYRNRLVIPKALRATCLSALHAAHQGSSMMNAKTEDSIFWPGITAEIQEIRDTCNHCNRMAPSQPSMPPVQPSSPTYPFQSICADYFSHAGHQYLVVVDRYSGWPIVERATSGAVGLATTLRKTFATYGIPDDITTDGGPEFTSTVTKKLLTSWGTLHRLSSVANPHSNCRAEVGVKIIKRLIAGNAGSNGDIDIDSFQKAILQYRNTPDPSTKISPATIVFGRSIKDLIPVLPGKYHPHPYWTQLMLQRERTLDQRHARDHDRWTEHSRPLPPLRVGDRVRVQNQTGNYPNKWDKTGVIVEVKQYHQYNVKMTDTGRVTLRNRKYLRRYERPDTTGHPTEVIPRQPPIPTQPSPPPILQAGEGRQPIPIITPPIHPDTTAEQPAENSKEQTPDTTTLPPKTPITPPPRRSARLKLLKEQQQTY